MFYVEHFIKRKGTAHCSAVPFCFMLSEFQNTPEIKNFQTYANEDDAAQNGCLAGELGAKLFADAQARHADKEGDHRNDERCRKCHQPAVFRNGEAHRKRIDTGGDALHEQCTRTQLCGLFGLFALDAIHQHFAANIAQQSQRDPRDELFKRREQLHNGVHAHPACHGHHGLKKGKGARDPAHGSPAHAGVVQAVCHGHRERVHCKAHAQQGTVEEKYKTPFHIVCLLNLTRISGNTKPGHGRTCTSGTG